MPRKKVILSDSEVNIQPMRPALTPEAREQQMISLAMDLVESRLRNGTASSQETTHFLKLASTNAKLEQEKLLAEKKLLEAKVANLESQSASEELYSEAIKAMKCYTGTNDSDEDEVNNY